MKRKKVVLYGLLAQFDRAEDLLRAAREAHAAGYRRLDAYTPFPVHGLAEAIGFEKTGVPLLVLGGGIFGACGGYFLQWYASAVSYPWNIGGRPLNSWPSFLVITFEMTVLFGGLAAVLGMLALNGLPPPHHPLFNVPSLELASRTHFFLCIQSLDPRFDREATRRFLEKLGPSTVEEVPMLATSSARSHGQIERTPP